jgi:hypothetical protein
MTAIETVPCNKDGSVYKYDLDTKRFNDAIFKFCASCGVFVSDFSLIFCGCNDCGRKLEYLDVTNLESLKNWLTNFTAEIPKPKITSTEIDFSDHEGELMSDIHNCEDSDDCIDCEEQIFIIEDEETVDLFDLIDLYNQSEEERYDTNTNILYDEDEDNFCDYDSCG